MGTTLASIFEVNISLATLSAQAKGFGRGLILGSANRYTGGLLYKIYDSAKAMLSDGFLITDPEYLAAKKYFSPSPVGLPAPKDVMVGYAPPSAAGAWTVALDAIADHVAYTVTIDGTPVTITSGTGATQASIVAALISAINAALPLVVLATTAELSLENVGVMITSLVSGTPHVITVTANMEVHVTTAPAGVSIALDAITVAGGTAWYALNLCSHVKVDILDAADWIETNGNDGLYVFEACTSDADVLTSATTDVLSELKALNYMRTGSIWSDDAAHYPEAAIMGIMQASIPGKRNMAWTGLSGIVATSDAVLNANALSNLVGKNGNYYCTVDGNDVLQDGRQANGQWFDIVFGRDWIVSNAQAALFTVLIQAAASASGGKIDYDNGGIGLLCNALRGVLKTAKETNGILESYYIDVPEADSISAAQKQTRLLPPITFGGVLRGAINGGAFVGTLTN